MSTLHVSNKTHPGVLLQPQALEDAVADNQKGTDETGRITAHVVDAGVHHGRGAPCDYPSTGVREHREPRCYEQAHT